MGLVLEISIDVKKNNSITESNLFLSELAEKFDCYKEYFLYETEGYNSIIERNDCIHVIEFNNPETEKEKQNILKFIEIIIKKKQTRLETIYRDTGKIDIIYNCIKTNYIDMCGKQKQIKNKPIINIIRERL
jgi:hypothetical protein